jgi:hypothetical protein
MYEWRIVFRNDRMGFQKQYAVIADDYLGAVEAGIALLESARYVAEAFAVIQLTRGRITAAAAYVTS